MISVHFGAYFFIVFATNHFTDVTSSTILSLLTNGMVSFIIFSVQKIGTENIIISAFFTDSILLELKVQFISFAIFSHFSLFFQVIVSFISFSKSLISIFQSHFQKPSVHQIIVIFCIVKKGYV
jgi:hypothetical protein